MNWNDIFGYGYWTGFGTGNTPIFIKCWGSAFYKF